MKILHKIWALRFVIPPVIALLAMLYYTAFAYSSIYLEKEFVKPFTEQTSFLEQTLNENN